MLEPKRTRQANAEFVRFNRILRITRDNPAARWTPAEMRVIHELEDQLALNDHVEAITIEAGCAHDFPCDVEDSASPCNEFRKWTGLR